MRAAPASLRPRALPGAVGGWRRLQRSSCASWRGLVIARGSHARPGCVLGSTPGQAMSSRTAPCGLRPRRFVPGSAGDGRRCSPSPVCERHSLVDRARAVSLGRLLPLASSRPVDAQHLQARRSAERRGTGSESPSVRKGPALRSASSPVSRTLSHSVSDDRPPAPCRRSTPGVRAERRSARSPRTPGRRSASGRLW